MATCWRLDQGPWLPHGVCRARCSRRWWRRKRLGSKGLLIPMNRRRHSLCAGEELRAGLGGWVLFLLGSRTGREPSIQQVLPL